MMQTKFSALLLLLAFIGTNAQENPLAVFNTIIGKKWYAEGNWEDGSKFKQEIIFEYVLDSTLVIAHSKGYTNAEKTQYGNRNHGIRKFDNESEEIKFWEFDSFGGVTTGKVIIDNKDLRYEYDYGGTLVSDAWDYVDDRTYNFTVGHFVNGKWKQIYLRTQFTTEK